MLRPPRLGALEDRRRIVVILERSPRLLPGASHRAAELRFPLLADDGPGKSLHQEDGRGVRLRRNPASRETAPAQDRVAVPGAAGNAAGAPGEERGWARAARRRALDGTRRGELILCVSRRGVAWAGRGEPLVPVPGALSIFGRRRLARPDFGRDRASAGPAGGRRIESASVDAERRIETGRAARSIREADAGRREPPSPLRIQPAALLPGGERRDRLQQERRA